LLDSLYKNFGFFQRPVTDSLAGRLFTENAPLKIVEIDCEALFGVEDWKKHGFMCKCGLCLPHKKNDPEFEPLYEKFFT
jgi:hypothetical protein